MPLSYNPKVFISYSHRDEDWKNLARQSLEAINHFEIWDDRNIDLGDTWFDKIEDRAYSADIAILLISDNFLNSNFIQTIEIPLFLKRCKEENLKLVPIILSSCHWESYSWLSSRQGYPRDNKPLDLFQVQNHLTFDLCPKIREQIKLLVKRVKDEYDNQADRDNEKDKIFEILINFMLSSDIQVNDLQEISKKYLSDINYRRTIEQKMTFKDLIDYLDNHDKEPLSCIIKELYDTTTENVEIEEWLENNPCSLSPVSTYLAPIEQNTTDRIIVDFEYSDGSTKLYDVTIRYYENGRFVSNKEPDYTDINIDDEVFQKIFVKKLYDIVEPYQYLELVLPKELLLTDIKQWGIDQRTRLTRKYEVNIHLRERAYLESKNTFLDLWLKKMTMEENTLHESIKKMDSEDDEVTKDTEEAGLIYCYQPTSFETFYDDMLFSFIALRCADNSQFESYQVWWNSQENTLKLKDLKAEVNRDENKHMTLIWDDPNIPLQAGGIDNG